MSSLRRQVLVTGSNGFIGKNLVNALLSDGWAVLAAVHKMASSLQTQSDLLKIVQADINDQNLMNSLVAQVDAVCHLAAYIPDNHEDPSLAEACIQTNALATLHLATSAAKHRISKFIFASGGNSYVYSKSPVAEDDRLYPVERATYYLASKLLGEMYIEHLRLMSSFNSICLRISTPYGWGMSPRALVSQVMQLASKASTIDVWDGGVTTYDYVDVEDVVSVMLSALQSGSPGIYNVGSGQACSVLELAQTVTEVFPENSIPIVVKPPQRTIPASFPALSIEKAKQTWGYSPRELKSGLMRYRQEMESSLNEYLR
jgi:nucleoside-diphosphate-sugar epimerase